MDSSIRSTLQTLLSQLQQALEKINSTDSAENINNRFAVIFEMIDNAEEYNHLAQDAISDLITLHPNLSHLVPRLLLWQLGGSCLHFLSDEEMDEFSAMSELH
ncbi:MAG: putative membrane protein YccC [Motiliproteus sp.]|jgi:uncharacterized membrane protein YccC